MTFTEYYILVHAVCAQNGSKCSYQDTQTHKHTQTNMNNLPSSPPPPSHGKLLKAIAKLLQPKYSGTLYWLGSSFTEAHDSMWGT